METANNEAFNMYANNIFLNFFLNIDSDIASLTSMLLL